MSEEENCPNGHPDCNFAEKHEIALAGKILRMIESYTEANETYPCPRCLRNSIMAIAAMLHIEASKSDWAQLDLDATEHGFVESFTDAARERIVSMIEAVVDIDSLIGKRRLM